MTRKWIIVGIFLSLVPVGLSSIQSEAKEETGTVEEVHEVSLLLKVHQVKTFYDIQTLKVALNARKPIVQQPLEAPESVDMASCGPHSLTWDEARACWFELISQQPWPAEKAFQIMYCESTGNYANRNRHSTATGLFQVLGGPIDPATNIQVAYSMYSEGGWNPWNASKSCWG